MSMASVGSGKAICSAIMPWCVSPSNASTLIFKPDIQFRALEPLLKSSAYPADARVIWSSSLESSPAFYKDADWQLMNTKHSYEAAKYQIDLIGTVLDRRALQDSSSTKRIRHFVSHPGVCSTKFSNNLVAFGGFLDTLKVIVFYLVRQTKLCCA